MKKLYSFLPALIFLVFLGVMALLLLFSPVRDYSENEKRYLAGRPEVTVSGILEGETQEQLEKFTADQVPGRDFFVGVNAYWNLATGRNGAQDIYHCKQGYLINAPKTYNEKIFTDNLTKFDQFAAQLGVPADLMMVYKTAPSQAVTGRTGFRFKLLNGVLQSLTGLEGGQLGSLDGDLGAGLGVAALALGAFADLKGAKADQRDLVAVLQGSGDGVQGAVDSSLGILLGQVRIVRNSGDQFNFRHSIIPPKYYISKKRLRKSPSARLTS